MNQMPSKLPVALKKIEVNSVGIKISSSSTEKLSGSIGKHSKLSDGQNFSRMLQEKQGTGKVARASVKLKSTMPPAEKSGSTSHTHSTSPAVQKHEMVDSLWQMATMSSTLPAPVVNVADHQAALQTVTAAVADRMASNRLGVATKPLATTAGQKLAQNPLATTAVQELAQKPLATTAVQELAQKPLTTTAVKELAQKPLTTTAVHELAQKPLTTTVVQKLAQKPLATTVAHELAQKPLVIANHAQAEHLSAVQIEKLRKAMNVQPESIHNVPAGVNPSASLQQSLSTVPTKGQAKSALPSNKNNAVNPSLMQTMVGLEQSPHVPVNQHHSQIHKMGTVRLSTAKQVSQMAFTSPAALFSTATVNKALVIRHANKGLVSALTGSHPSSGTTTLRVRGLLGAVAQTHRTTSSQKGRNSGGQGQSSAGSQSQSQLPPILQVWQSVRSTHHDLSGNGGFSVAQGSGQSQGMNSGNVTQFVQASQFVPDIVRYVMNRATRADLQNSSVMVLTLTPEHLGKVRLSVASGNDGSLHIRLGSESAESSNLIQSNLGNLQQQLEKNGYSSVLIDVYTQGRQSGQGSPEQPLPQYASVPELRPLAATATTQISSDNYHFREQTRGVSGAFYAEA